MLSLKKTLPKFGNLSPSSLGDRDPQIVTTFSDEKIGGARLKPVFGTPLPLGLGGPRVGRKNVRNRENGPKSENNPGVEISETTWT